MTQFIKRLPAVFQTAIEKKFFDATVDQLFTKKDSDYLSGYLGRHNPGYYDPQNDFYLPEISKNRTTWQLEPVTYSLTSAATKTNILFYEDLLDHLKLYGGNVGNQDRLFESEYYSFAPPIDYDMFINYQNYYWIEQGLPVIPITGVLSSDIAGQSSYTTPSTAQPPNFTLINGMKVQLVSDTANPGPYTIENIGGCIGIRLVPQFTDFTAGTILENLPWDNSITLTNGRVIENTTWDENTWDTETRPLSGDYITIERGSINRNAWSRTNKWFHLDAINASLTITNTAFPNNATRALRPIIQFTADLNLYKSGSTYRDTIDYGFRNDNFGHPILFTDFQYHNLTQLNNTYGIQLTDGSLISFFDDTNTIVADTYDWDTTAWEVEPDQVTSEPWDQGNTYQYNQYIFVVNLQPDGTIFLYPKTSYLTPVTDNEILFINADAPYDGALKGQTWYFLQGVWSEAFNDKTQVNQPPLFQLYDHNGVTLDDSVTYPNSTFLGNKIFSYKVDTTNGATVDPVLGFPIVYSSLGQATDIIFQNNLITNRYTYGSFIPIDGYYYYKNSTSETLYNNWDLYSPCQCVSNTQGLNCNNVSRQRVIDQYTVITTSKYYFPLSVIPYGYPTSPDILVNVNGIEVRNSSIQTNGYDIISINNKLYVDLTSYINALLLTPQVTTPVVELQTYTTDVVDDNSTGWFEIPQQLEANPSQDEVTEITGSELIQHFTSIIRNQIGFTGTAFGGSNNYKDSLKNQSVGDYILQNTAPILKSMFISSADNVDFIKSVRFSQDEYTKFKNRYLSVALQLINQQFDPVQYQNNSVVINYWVDQILKTINISKEFSDAFKYSYMIASGTPTYTSTITTSGNASITLANYADLGQASNVLYIYDTTTSGNPTLLLVGKDYSIIDNNLSIDIKFNIDTSTHTFVTYLYVDALPTYIPSTPTKLGLAGATFPSIELDSTYAIPTNVIIGHDGSRTIAYGDYRDQLLLELEKRIYNGLNVRFQTDYRPLVNFEDVNTGFYRQTRYSRDELLTIMQSYLNKWAAKNQANYHQNEWSTSYTSISTNNIWKLYNYSQAIDNNGTHLNLPGHWKGIFRLYYDTLYPDTRPWEMLGFTEQPIWWTTEYGQPSVNSQGQNVWTSTSTGLHSLWADLEAGVIRQGPRAIYDQTTMLPVAQAEWARPGLSLKIPVTSAGEIIPIPTLFNISTTGDIYAPFDNFDADWAFGDGAPVEEAWKATSEYKFSIQEILYLTRPGPYGEFMWDTIGTEYSPGTLSVSGIVGPVQDIVNRQYIQNNIYSSSDAFFSWMRPKNADQYVHAETLNGAIQLRSGYQNWISDRQLFLGQDITVNFGQLIRTLGVNLANKFGGFTNKNTSNIYLESVTPGATTNTLAIPSTNFEVILYKGQPVRKYTYSGVIIRALADGTFAIYGYDLLNSSFVVLNRSESNQTTLSIGGTPAEYQYYANGATYHAGDIVRYNGIYYESQGTQTLATFGQGSWIKLSALPTSGGVSVIYHPNTDGTTSTLPYGMVLPTVQAVFDFLIGWGDYLKSQGWQFEGIDPATTQVNDWLSSAKQFLFWITTNWAPNAIIQLSPLASEAILNVDRGYPDDITEQTNEIYNILDKNGVSISPKNTIIDRAGQTVTVTPANEAAGGIFYLTITSSETEHILIFDNSTNFGDIVYTPLLRDRQQRLKFNGFRSNGWYGKMEAPGYLVINDQLVPNYDTIAESIRYFYDPNITIDNTSLESLGRHLIGYESKSYLNNLQITDNIQYQFYKGSIREKGTVQTVDKLFRSEQAGSGSTVNIYEEWALRLSNFGNTIENVTTEFILNPIQDQGQSIVARMNYIPSTIGYVKEILILNAQNTYTKIPKIVIALPDATPNTYWAFFSFNAIYNAGDVVRYDDANGNPIYYQSNITQGPGLFNISNWTAILTTRVATAYAVLDSTNKIARVDMIDQGYGYKTTPLISISSGTDANNLDILYGVWQGSFTTNTEANNIIDININDTSTWIKRPMHPTLSLPFPVTQSSSDLLPNAGYVHFNDVSLYSFDYNSAIYNWGSSTFNPIANDTIWLSKTFTSDWDVLKLQDVSSVGFSVWEDSSQNLFLKLPQNYPLSQQGSSTGNTTDLGNIIVLQIIEAQATPVLTNGILTSASIVKEGAGYISPPLVTITGDGIGATATAIISNGSVTDLLITDGGTGYSTMTISIAAPPTVNGDTNYAVGFEFDSTTTSIQNDGNNYYSLVTLAGTSITSTDIPLYLNFNHLILFKTMRFLTMPQIPSYIVEGDKFWVDQVGIWPVVQWGVYTYTQGRVIEFRSQESLIDTSAFKVASIFGPTGQEIIELPIFDPFKGVIPGPAKQNITYITVGDPARYNVSSNPRLYNVNTTFGPRQVGQLWWDISNTRYVYYEQPMALDGSETETDNLLYRRQHWGQLFPGSTIDIYEWTESVVPPSQYTGAGTPRDVGSYVQITTTNLYTGVQSSLYYFWVQNTTNQPNLQNRTMTALNVAQMLQNPLSQNYSFYAPVQQTATNNSFMFYNIKDILAYQGNDIQIRYNVDPKDSEPHRQWVFYREGDSNSIISDQFWNKMVDSLCGYSDVLPVSNEWSNSIMVADYLPWDIFGWDIAPSDSAINYTSEIYGEVLPIPDPLLSTTESLGIEYRPRQSMFANIMAARKVFVQAANALLLYIPIRDNSPSWNSSVLTNNYWQYTNWYAQGYEYVTPSIVFSTLGDANTALLNGELQLGQIIQVNNGTTDGRYILYAVIQSGTLQLQEVCIENSAIAFLDTLYTDMHVYALSVELRQLLKALRNTVMINNYIVNQNDLFFSMLNYILTEQKDPSWVFKSSYIYVKETGITLTQSQLYIPDQITNVLDYINDIKPYHTQIRDYTSSYTTSDTATGVPSDQVTQTIRLQFGPNYSALSAVPEDVESFDAQAGWDLDQGDAVEPFDAFNWDIDNITNIISQFISGTPVPADFDPGSANWPDIITVSLTTYDASKVGFSQLYPYTFTFDNLNINNPQTFITPAQVIAIKIDTTVLNYGIDYYVEYNNDNTYTVYFYNSPGASTPVAYVLLDGGDLLSVKNYVPRTEIGYGYPKSAIVINSDTKLPVNNSTGILTPYVSWGDYWGEVPPKLGTILTNAGATATIPWGAPLSEQLLDDTVSSKTVVTPTLSENLRNGTNLMATLAVDLPVPTSATDNTQSVTVYVDPAIHTSTTDILPDPGNNTSAAVWINGERIEYRQKRLISADTWILELITRGSQGTGITAHTALIPSLANPLITVPNPVWIEQNTSLAVTSQNEVWNLYSLPAIPDTNTQVGTTYTSVIGVPVGGLWYSDTVEATFLMNDPGKSIP